MSRDVLLYLEDILTACQKILRFTSGMTMDGFILDDRTYDAVIRNLEIIGEAAKEIPDHLKEANPEVDWRAMIALRNIVAHEYFGILNEIIWDIVRNEIPLLSQKIEKLIDNSGSTTG